MSRPLFVILIATTLSASGIGCARKVGPARPTVDAAREVAIRVEGMTRLQGIT